MISKRYTGPALSALALMLGACGSSESSEETVLEDGTGDTGWVESSDDGTFRLARTMGPVSIDYSLTTGPQGPRANVVARAAPCMGGRGEVDVADTFTPYIADEAESMTQSQVALESVVSRLGDRCKLPDNLPADITSGFPGAYFRAAQARAAVTGN